MQATLDDCFLSRLPDAVLRCRDSQDLAQSRDQHRLSSTTFSCDDGEAGLQLHSLLRYEGKVPAEQMRYLPGACAFALAIAGRKILCKPNFKIRRETLSSLT